MSGNATEGSDHFDLLPLIGILMCVLGCLLLVTLSMAAISLGVGAGEAWTPASGARMQAEGLTTDPGGIAAPKTAAGKTAILIEWDGTTAVIHRDNKRIPLIWSKPSGVFIPKGMLDNGEDLWRECDKIPDSDKAFHETLTELVALRDKYYALFAVRPSGFENFQRLADEFRGRKMNVGFEPLLQARPVRLLLKDTDHGAKTPFDAVP
jgi:hypothetical protein